MHCCPECFSDDFLQKHIAANKISDGECSFCGAKNINRLQVLSDYKYRSFGYAYGVMIKEMMLLARAIFLIDKQNVIRYVEICPEVKEHPHYYEALEAVKSL